MNGAYYEDLVNLVLASSVAPIDACGKNGIRLGGRTAMMQASANIAWRIQ
jgi:hypothetical protein